MLVSHVPLALYIHIPWCVKKCPYCDFNSHELPSVSSYQLEDTYHTYIDALIADIASQLKFIQGRTVTSIFIGGGTPSLLPIEQFKRLFSTLRLLLPLADDIEITLEANPGTLEHAPFAEYLDIGINRLSIGVQTFHTGALKQLGRIHDPRQAQEAIKQARLAGFDRVNVDLMHGLPNQTVDHALTDINNAYTHGATHISWYQLTIEPNTVFYRNTPILPDENQLEAIEFEGKQLLQNLGFYNYEVSAWVYKSDVPCRHNMTYWTFGDYLAIGAGAHGKVSLQDIKEYQNGIYRFSKSRLPKDYIKETEDSKTAINTPKMVGWHRIDDKELASEFMMNALRLTLGFNKNEYIQRTDMTWESIEPTLIKLQNQGLLALKNNHVQLTLLGARFVNKVIKDFL